MVKRCTNFALNPGNLVQAKCLPTEIIIISLLYYIKKHCCFTRVKTIDQIGYECVQDRPYNLLTAAAFAICGLLMTCTVAFAFGVIIWHSQMDTAKLTETVTSLQEVSWAE